MKRLIAILIFSGLGCVQADSIAHGNMTVSMDFVEIKNAGNAAKSGYGAVDYDYRMGVYEVTADQWIAVKVSDRRVGVGSKAPFWSGKQPAAKMIWPGAAMFCNWLTSGDAYKGAYQFDSAGVLAGIDRAAALAAYGKVYALPTEDEWMKAAYFKDGKYSVYANGTRKTPSVDEANFDKERKDVWAVGSGSVNQNGTYDMDGNVAEWTESAYDGSDSLVAERATRDGSFFFHASSVKTRNARALDYSTSHYGFRVVELEN